MSGNYSRLFEKYTDEQLLELTSQRDTLLDAGKIAFDEEMLRRGFNPHEPARMIKEVTTPSGQKMNFRALSWFAPTAGFYMLTLVMMANPNSAKNLAVLGLALGYYLTSPFGSFWMLYQSIRFESKPLKYILLSFLPYAFLWYYFERVRKRTYVGRLPVSVR